MTRSEAQDTTCAPQSVTALHARFPANEPDGFAGEGASGLVPTSALSGLIAMSSCLSKPTPNLVVAQFEFLCVLSGFPLRTLRFKSLALV